MPPAVSGCCVITQSAATLTLCTQGLVRVCGFKEEPVEWVYTGVGPLLLRDVLAARKGVAASLALLASCIARRLHVHLLPYLPPGAAQAGELPRVHAC